MEVIYGKNEGWVIPQKIIYRNPTKPLEMGGGHLHEDGCLLGTIQYMHGRKTVNPLVGKGLKHRNGKGVSLPRPTYHLAVGHLRQKSGSGELLCAAHGQLAAAVAPEGIALAGLREKPVLRVVLSLAEVLGAVPAHIG